MKKNIRNLCLQLCRRHSYSHRRVEPWINDVAYGADHDVAPSMGQAYADGKAVGIDMPPHGLVSVSDR